MWVRAYVAIATALVSLSSLSESAVQAECAFAAANEWLRQPSASDEGSVVSNILIRPVDRNVAAAEALLDERSILALDPNQVSTFVGDEDIHRIASKGSRPYLVRSVFPTPVPKLDVRWSGVDLHVFASGLGCFKYTKRPLVIFLDRKPAKVYVMASAAL
ncbi:hypothetical protein [Sphingomonas sp.]|jgi:hypothetical protein|uniref:hypothetical protein n=1 Tax=Sphingomonas sp. TaxID=28214 RepID=UPI0035C867A5